MFPWDHLGQIRLASIVKLNLDAQWGDDGLELSASESPSTRVDGTRYVQAAEGGCHTALVRLTEV